MSFFLEMCPALDHISALEWDGVSSHCWCTVDCAGSSYEIKAEVGELNSLWPYAEQMLRAMSAIPRSGRERARLLIDAFNSASTTLAGPVWIVSKSLMQWDRWTETKLEDRLPGEDLTLLVSGPNMGASLTFASLERNAPGFSVAWVMCLPLELRAEEVTTVLKALLTEPLCAPSRSEDERQAIQAELLRARDMGLSAQESVAFLYQTRDLATVLPLPTLSMDI